MAILAEPEHRSGLGLDMTSLMEIVGKRSIDQVDHGITYQLAYITPTHFAINPMGQAPNGSAEIAKNYPGLRKFLPVA